VRFKQLTQILFFLAKHCTFCLLLANEIAITSHAAAKKSLGDAKYKNLAKEFSY